MNKHRLSSDFKTAGSYKAVFEASFGEHILILVFLIQYKSIIRGCTTNTLVSHTDGAKCQKDIKHIRECEE